MLTDVLAALDQAHSDRVSRFEMYRDYLAGNHRWDFLTDRYTKTNSWVTRIAQENLMPAVIDVYSDKISVADWGLDDDSPLGTETLDRLLAMVTNSALAHGNAFTLTWNDPRTGEPVAALQQPDQCIPIVDPDDPGRLVEFGKLWVPKDGFPRLNIYDSQCLTRWISKAKTLPGVVATATNLDALASQWIPFDSEGAPHEESHDFGVVPAVWWKRDAPDPFAWGESILRDAIPVQDELNKLAADALVASERIALPIRYLLGLAQEYFEERLNPATGRMEAKRLEFDEAKNSILALGQATSAGQFPAPDAASLIALQEHAEAKLSRVTGIPPYYFRQGSGDSPSGESLRVVSSRLNAAVQAFERDALPCWVGQLQLLGVADPDITWADPMPMSDAERLDNAAAAKDLGVGGDKLAEIAGVAPEDFQSTLARAGRDVYGG